MSTQLENAGIELHEGYSREALKPAPDQVVIGNALGRGNPAVEYVLNRNLPMYRVRNGWPGKFSAIVGCWRRPVPTVKPRQLP